MHFLITLDLCQNKKTHIPYYILYREAQNDKRRQSRQKRKKGVLQERSIFFYIIELFIEFYCTFDRKSVPLHANL